MTTPPDSTPASHAPRTAFYDSVFAYADRCNAVLDDGADEIALRTIELRHGDGDVAIYDRAGNWLACEEGREAAVKDAHFVVTALINGARWALSELAPGRGHLQRHFPEIARKYRCPPCDREPASLNPS